jgi:hypothetical protein
MQVPCSEGEPCQPVQTLTGQSRTNFFLLLSFVFTLRRRNWPKMVLFRGNESGFDPRPAHHFFFGFFPSAGFFTAEVQSSHQRRREAELGFW